MTWSIGSQGPVSGQSGRLGIDSMKHVVDRYIMQIVAEGLESCLSILNGSNVSIFRSIDIQYLRSRRGRSRGEVAVIAARYLYVELCSRSTLSRIGCSLDAGCKKTETFSGASPLEKFSVFFETSVASRTHKL